MVLHLPRSTYSEWEFKRYFGSPPAVIADVWSKVLPTLPPKQKSPQGFRLFMIAQHFLWAYPKNSTILTRTFGVGLKVGQGKSLWNMVRSIADLMDAKVKWDPDFDRLDTEIFIISVDGKDFRIWEPKHPERPYDKDYSSHKYSKKAALRYEIALSLKHSRIVWISGPHKAGLESDLGIFNSGLKKKILPGKKAVCDGTYKGSAMLAKPDCLESKELKNFKSRARNRQETINRRLVSYKALATTFTHGIDNHELAFKAVVVMVQTQMEHGAELFAI